MVFPSTTYLISCTFLLRSCRTFQQIMRASPWKQRVCEALLLGSVQVCTFVLLVCNTQHPVRRNLLQLLVLSKFRTLHKLDIWVPEAGILGCSIDSRGKNEKLLTQSHGFTHFLKQIRLLGVHLQLRHPYFESPELQFESWNFRSKIEKKEKSLSNFPGPIPDSPESITPAGKIAFLKNRMATASHTCSQLLLQTSS